MMINGAFRFIVGCGVVRVTPHISQSSISANTYVNRLVDISINREEFIRAFEKYLATIEENADLYPL